MKKHLIWSLLPTTLLFAPLTTVLAQSAEPVFSEGVAGQTDTKDRTPVVSVGSVVKDGSVVLLLNAYVRDEDTKIYPTKFEVFVANKLVASLLKPAEQVDPLVVPIDPKIATAPLNYTVHAQIIHPSRTFSTVSSGTIFTSTLVAENLTCEIVTVSDSSDTQDATETTYNAEGEDVSLTQTADTTFSLNISAKDTEDNSLTATGSVLLTEDGSASSTLNVTEDGVESSQITTGTVTLDDSDAVQSLELATEDESFSLSCAK